MSRIQQLDALEILDSRGRPTVQATCLLASGARESASVPSGASTGTAEALELRDGDQRRYGGLGCQSAVQNIKTKIAQHLRNRELANQAELDQALLDLDATANKSSLGANSILAVSLAFARAQATERERPLYRHFADILALPERHRLPRLTINLFSGGKHAGGQVAIQDVLMVPGADSIHAGLSDAYSVYQQAVKKCGAKYRVRALVADEGGLAPPFPNTTTMLSDALDAAGSATLPSGQAMKFAVDVASTHFYKDGKYEIDGRTQSAQEMIELLKNWCDQFPILSIEDGLAEEDWEHWPQLRRNLPSHVLVLGDDLLCTNPARIQRAIECGAANALLLKVNQIGTLSEAAEACRIARSAGWKVTVSARSGETEDSWLADLAVAWGDQIKVGSITRSERLAKYNRLLAIEEETGWKVED